MTSTNHRTLLLFYLLLTYALFIGANFTATTTPSQGRTQNITLSIQATTSNIINTNLRPNSNTPYRHDPLLELIMNAENQNMTAKCKLHSGRMFTLYFKKINESDVITDMKIHAENSHGSKPVVFSCNLDSYYCRMWNVNRVNATFIGGRMDRKSEYTLWVTAKVGVNAKTPTVIWRRAKRFKPAKHLLGCRDRDLKLKVDDIQMSSIQVSWKSYTVMKKFKPKQYIFLDDNNFSKAEKNSFEITHVDICRPHTICLHTVYKKRNSNITDKQCVSVPNNCTSKEPLMVDVSKSDLILLLVLITAIALVVGILCCVGKRYSSLCKRHNKIPELSECDEEYLTGPRGADPIYAEIAIPPDVLGGDDIISKRKQFSTSSSTDDSIIMVVDEHHWYDAILRLFNPYAVHNNKIITADNQNLLKT